MEYIVITWGVFVALFSTINSEIFRISESLKPKRYRKRLFQNVLPPLQSARRQGA